MKPEKQLKLYGFKNVFNELINIDANGNFPNKILFSGIKGIGKSTLAYHLTNYFLSYSENNKYNIDENQININNNSFNLVLNNYHPNFFKIDLKYNKKNIEISQIREMINFTNKSSFDNKSKIILIDNVELLSISATNSLLKIIEEPNNKVLFFLIYNNYKKITNTLKSRCIEFKLNLNEKYIKQVVNSFFDDTTYDLISSDFKNYFSSPLNYIDFITFCNKNDLNFNDISIEEFIKFFIQNNIYKTDILVKNNVKHYIELFFRKKVNTISNIEFFNFYNYFNKKYDLVTKFNLDLESFFLEFNSKLLNE